MKFKSIPLKIKNKCKGHFYSIFTPTSKRESDPSGQHMRLLNPSLLPPKQTH